LEKAQKLKRYTSLVKIIFESESSSKNLHGKYQKMVLAIGKDRAEIRKVKDFNHISQIRWLKKEIELINDLAW